MEALRLLGERIDDSRKTVVLLDEISWIGREIEREIADKVDAFPKRRGVSIRTALVYEGELDESVARSGAFDILLPFSRLLGID